MDGASRRGDWGIIKEECGGVQIKNAFPNLNTSTAPAQRSESDKGLMDACWRGDSQPKSLTGETARWVSLSLCGGQQLNGWRFDDGRVSASPQSSVIDGNFSVFYLFLVGVTV